MPDHVPDWRSPLLLVAVLAGTILTAAAGPAQGPLAEKAAWYSFERPDEPGRSTGPIPWPAYAFRAKIGEGRIGSGLIMPGLGANGLLLPNPAAFFGENAAAGTVALWIRPDFDPVSEPAERVAIDFMKQTRNTRVDGYEIVILTAPGKLAAQPALGRRMVIDTPLRQGEWTHVALTWDAALGTVLYVDGERAAEIKAAFDPTPLEWWPGRLGCHTPSGGYPFKGAVDELRLFNRMLTDEEVRQIARPSRPPVDLVVSGWEMQTLKVRNNGPEPVRLRLQSSRPVLHVAQERWGHLPLPEHEAGPDERYIGGAWISVYPISQPVTIAPQDSASMDFPADSGECGWVRYSLMAGEGLACREVWSKDLKGLLCRLDPPYLVASRTTNLRLVIENQLGRNRSGTIAAKLTGSSGEQPANLGERPADLKAGRRAVVVFEVPPGALRPGQYHLDLWLSGGPTGPRWHLRGLRVPVVEATTYRTLFGVGAAYVSHPPGDELLAAMAADRVKVLRRSGAAWFRDRDEVVPYGFRAWRTPAWSANAICTDPEAVRRADKLARDLGACLRDKPTVLNQVMLGEGLSRTPCYCDDCNAAFREYLQERYADISRLNEAWGTSYESFRQINQLGSPHDVSEAAERMALMQRELPAAVAQRWRELFLLDPPRAIEWKRWHDGILIDWYERFARAFHQANKHHTALSEQPCWPDFKHHVLFALGETADLGGMDLYLPGELPTTLGYASELFMNFDLNASIFHGKPLWVHELYVQDNSPPLLPEAQGWFLVGRGYSMLTYFTYDYYKEGVRANLPLIFGLFDEERRPYPAYHSFLRFGEQMEQFHRQYDAFSLRREEPRVAVFLGDDVSLANSLETGGETWGAAGVHGHIGAYWLAERNGFPVEFINDDRLSRLQDKRVLIVPWTHVIRPASIRAILRFARSGGTVILDGPVGLHDDLYRPYSPMPGGRAMEGLGIGFGEYQDESNALIVGTETDALPLTADTRVTSRGVPVEVKLSGWRVLAHDEHGSPALVHRELGQGQLFWLLTNTGREHRGRAPDPNAVALWRGMIESAGIASRHVVRSGVATGAQPGAADLDHGGKGVTQGDPLCDAAIRLRGDSEAFIFLVSFFNATQGELLLRVPEGHYQVTDAITGDSIVAQRVGEGLSLPIDLLPFGSRVCRVQCADGSPFWDW